MNRKGFLFTISVIMFATTLVFYSQVYSENILRSEYLIIEDYKYKTNYFISNDISMDLMDIFNIDIDYHFLDNNIYLKINGEIPNNDIIHTLNNYENFLENNYFTKINGNEEIDLDNIKDGSFDINYDFFDFVYDYENEKVYNNGQFDKLDINLLVDDHLNSIDFYFERGSTPVYINYFDNNNIVLLDKNIGLSSLSYVRFIYDDSNVLLKIGLHNGKYFDLDSNINNKINYSILFVNEFDQNFLELNINSKLDYEFDNFSSDSYISIN